LQTESSYNQWSLTALLSLKGNVLENLEIRNYGISITWPSISLHQDQSEHD